MLRFCCIFLLALISCHIDKPTGNFKRILNSSHNIKSQKLNFGGVYHNNSEDNYYLERPIYFFSNGLFYYDNGSVTDSAGLAGISVWIDKYLQQKKAGWGAYEIIGDTIKGSVYYNFSTPVVNYRLANFEGIIKNKDTILQWHLVEPYPKLKKYPREEFDFLFKDQKDFYFKPLPIKQTMDSISKKAWILKYRDKK